MGFYGNITNTSRTQFQFDKTYPNRKVMDTFAKSDGIYVGRYVLVEYDNQLAADWCTMAYQKTINGVVCFFSAPMDASGNPQVDTKYRFGVGDIITGKYIRVPGVFTDTNGEKRVYNLDEPGKESDLVYHIDGKLDESNNVKVTLISDLPNSPYNENYNIDVKSYGPGRGYDSTVWQKVYANGDEKYVMIAELNSVVPTFGISADAPSLSPVAPHFDADSTNVFYRVHWQPNWGFRIKSASPNISVAPINDAGATIDGNYITISKRMESKFPSDATTSWTRAAYDTATGQLNKFYFDPAINPDTLETTGRWIKSDEAPATAQMPAAIYFNKAGFNPAIISYSEADVLDKIALEATGLSGYQYNLHDSTGAKEPQVDTQELSILLPSIGNSIAQMWDIVYGNEKINGGKNRNLAINWSQGSIVPDTTGLRLVTRTEKGYGYDKEQVSTLAGAINSVHDLMGMIIQDKDNIEPESANVSDWNEDYIYYLINKERYYRKHKSYAFESPPADYEPFTKVSMQEWAIPHSYYYLDYVPSNPYNNITKTNYPNYILEPYARYSERQYYEQVTVNGEGRKGSSFEGVFEPNKFFVRGTKKITFSGTEFELTSHVISLDKTFNSQSGYHTITHKSLGNTRFWVEGEFYTTTFTEDTEPNELKFNEGLLFIKKEDGKYYRPTSYDPSVTMYKAGKFQTATGNYDKHAQYFAVSKKTENNITYIEQIKYYQATGVNATNFYYRVYYTLGTDNVYYPATTYVEGTVYYIKEVTLVETTANVSVSAKDIIEINVIPFEIGKGYCQYISGNSGGANGFDEYVEITPATLRYFTDNIVIITPSSDLSIYEPNLYYYQITAEGNPLKGSIVFDSNPIPTEDRTYYAADTVSYSKPVDYTGEYRPYEPSKYYYINAKGQYVLDTAPEHTEGRQYYEKNSLYVVSDSEGLFPEGMEWNPHVTKPDSVTLGIRHDVWKLQELEGFARHYNTIHGLILRLNKVLETDNTLTRDLSSIQGVTNKMKDLLLQFGEMRPNEIIVTNKLGRITTTRLAGDSWIKTTYSDESDISITHKYIGEDSGKGLHTVSGESANKTLTFGGSFISPSFNFTTDNMGHVNKFNTSNVTITMPTLAFTEGTDAGNVVTNITMDEGSGTNKITFTETRAYVGALALNGYTIASAEGTVSATDSINSAIGKIEYKLGSTTVSSQIDAKINALDVAAQGGDAYYISAISETNGKISATAKAIATSISSTSVNTALVSPKAVYDYLANTYIGTSNITTVGIISSGTWQGNAINATYIGSLPANKITSGTLDLARIPELPASKVTSGVFDVARIPNLNADKINSGVLGVARIPELDASKIISGTLGTDRIPSLDASKITSGTLGADRIPNLDATKIATGVLSGDRIPALDAGKITSGNFAGTRITLTDYAISTVAKQSITTSDNVNTAIAKLEKRIADLEATLAI